ncbi:MAG: hypothetical protein C5B50_13105 [Verrucomicrobia bacterium]|nr:MAG: hypothetical protein C5B50_13105 [Verrucomicrobiota bacterium]
MISLQNIRDLLATSELPELGPGPRAGVETEATLNRELDAKLKGGGPDKEHQDLIRALVLLWHDHLDAAHQIAQQIEGANGAFVHGIMHRREPDYGNAAYWFRRVGNHAAYSDLARRAGELLDAEKESELKKELLPRGEWNVFGFINACERVAGRSDASETQLLRRIQQIETETLLESLCGG